MAKKIKWKKVGVDVDSKPQTILNEGDYNRVSTSNHLYRPLQNASSSQETRQEFEYHNKLLEWYVWFEGRIPQLRRFYINLDIERYKYLGGDRNSFWKAVNNKNRLIHSRIPNVISKSMADLMMGNGIEIESYDTKLWGKDKIKDLKNEINSIDLGNALYEAAVNASWAGTGFIKWDFDDLISPYPIPSSINPLNIRLYSKYSHPYRADTFHEVKGPSGTIYRVIEKREIHLMASKKHELHINVYFSQKQVAHYERKTDEELKRETKELKGVWKELGLELDNTTKILNTDSLLIVPIPNKLPNPIIDSRCYGISDYFGVEEQFDALDESLSHMMDVIRKGKFTRYVPKAMILRDENGDMVRFDDFTMDYIVTNEDIENSETSIRTDDPDVDIDKYLEAYKNILGLTLINVGLTPYTIGFQATGLDGRDLSDRRERYSARTRENKRRLWEPQINRIVRSYIVARDLWKDGKDRSDLTKTIGVYGHLRSYNIPTFEARCEFWTEIRDDAGCDLETMVNKIYIDLDEKSKKRLIKNIRIENNIKGEEDSKVTQDDLLNPLNFGKGVIGEVQKKNTNKTDLPKDKVNENQNEKDPINEKPNNKTKGIEKAEKRGK